jgi:glycine/D-amino acid oxidase-like deaminating enzyme
VGGPAFDAPSLPVFGADISESGTYGFPRHHGVVKVARHGAGRVMASGDVDSRVVTAEEVSGARSFLSRAMPGIGEAPLAATRICVYGQTADGHPVIAPSPSRPGLVVACGGSGHFFKFGPVVGALVADAVEGTVVPRFSWRTAGSVEAPDAARAR